MSDSPTGLLSLDIDNFRNIEAARLLFSTGLNLITGSNAAGKTSLLEAIYCLGRVRSFRTPDSNQLIRDGHPSYRLVGRIGLPDHRAIPIGIERQQGKYQIHLEGQAVRRLSDLAGRFPVHLMTGDTANILNGGPRYRRQTLDWALFHVEQGYRNAWQRYARALRQRNAALRAQAPGRQVAAWDVELVDAAVILDRLRRQYLADLEPHLREELTLLMPGKEVTIRYLPGWARDLSLSKALENSLDKDCAQCYTHCGPHRADFSLLVDEKPVIAHYSRGQQKATTLAFLMGQVRLQHATNAPKGAFLLDDLGSELDADHQARVLGGLAELHHQVFVTSIDTQALDIPDWPVNKRFHVEHGEVQEVV